jgi:hypothetical protein
VPDFLVCPAAVVLQDVVLFGTCGHDQLLCDWLRDKYQSVFSLQGASVLQLLEGSDRAYQDIGQVVVGDIGQLLAVELGDDELWH